MLDASLFHLPKGIVSRAISFENPTGEKGRGATAASPLGVGRKGDPARHLHPGETLQLADIGGPGIIRHIWLTTHPKPALLRGVVLRFYWEGQDSPAIECPVGDFFGFAHGKTPPFQSAAHSVGEKVGMNCWIPMPFSRRARIEIHNESTLRMPLFYQVDYTLGDSLPEDVAHLHVAFQRQCPTVLGEDLVLLQRQGGAGRFLGAVLGVIPSDPRWWGEGEMKVYLDGDNAFPTIAGTGAEDYVGLSWGIQPNAFLYHGASWRANNDISDTGPVSMYRWHITDPIYWREEVRVTLQQIGHSPNNATSMDEYKQELYERQDDWCAATFWYETAAAPLPPMPNVALRLQGLDELPNIPNAEIPGA
ncbi:MAG TPA: hypothetical protein DD459_00970 [Halieaceae bacterium]|nr:hypothetical protein [Halieaceae bacterium]|tara:strand:+ start:14334 stop:15422 length:1089 start_codon:yes stop_codon:yes gene_type:complete